MRIGLDAMGGDRGPGEIIAGAVAAGPYLDNGDRIVLVGDESIIRAELAKCDNCGHIEVVNASQAIDMAEPPVEAIRNKPDSSIVVMTGLHRQGKLDACISAGNTGACVAAAQMMLRRLEGVQRPGITVLAPGAKTPVALCDVGANVNCRPQHLYQYGVMASLYYQAARGVENPRVGLLSVGGEDGKGNDLVKKASELLRADPTINFIGNVEGGDLVRDICDVMICEGFVGNVVLKLVESIGTGLLKSFVNGMIATMPDQKERIMQGLEKISHLHDSDDYGGAPLLGVDGIWIICHGASKSKGIMNAVRVSMEVAARQVNKHIVKQLSRD
jgi:glycerol-3-phosphate acyltransferase PlsX